MISGEIFTLCDNMKLQHDRTIFLLFVNGFIDISWWCASRWLMMMLPMVRFIYLVLMMRKVSMSIVLMGLLAPLVVMVSASLLKVNNNKKSSYWWLSPCNLAPAALCFLGMYLVLMMRRRCLKLVLMGLLAPLVQRHDECITHLARDKAQTPGLRELCQSFKVE